MKLKSILLSWDSLASAALVLVLGFALAPRLPVATVKDLYGVGISVLSIVFSVFFAALAIIISSSDDAFVRFLEEEHHYTQLIWTFRWTLAALFVALIVSISAYAFTASQPAGSTQPKAWFLVFSGLFIYSLVAAFFSTHDAISYAHRRVQFLEERKKADAKNPEGTRKTGN